MKKKYLFGAAVFLLSAVLPAVVLAQSGRQKMASCLQPACIPVEKLGLSEAQKSNIQKIEKRYNDQIAGLRSELMSRRFELQSVFRNPQADGQQVREKAHEVMDLHNRCQEIMIDYQMEVRAILTPEQLKTWCTSTDSCFIKTWLKEP